MLGPSLVNRESRAALGDLSGSLDRGNLHPYSGGLPPLGNLDDESALMSAVSKGKPLQISEVGYHTDLAFTGPHRPASERAVGIYMPRHRARGVPLAGSSGPTSTSSPTCGPRRRHAEGLLAVGELLRAADAGT